MLELELSQLISKHLARLEGYVPAHGRGGAKLTAAELAQAFAEDPVYAIFGLDSPEYVAAALAGGTITSIHRKLGDVYEAAVRLIFAAQYGIPETALHYTALIAAGDRQNERSLDVYLPLESMPTLWQQRWLSYAHEALHRISPAPRIELTAIGVEVRHCYQSADSKRVQADEAMARHCLVSGILPVMMVFCGQSNRMVLNRYRSLWIVTEGLDSYNLLQQQTGFDFYGFLQAHRDEFRQPIIAMLRALQERL